MRKLIIALILISTISVFGQNHIVGLKGGINLTNVNSSNFLISNENRTGFNGGLTYEYRLNTKFGLGMDLLYFQKGFTNDIVFLDDNGNPTGESATSEFNYDYLSLPLKAGFVRGDKFLGFANLGIIPSLLISAKTLSPTIGGFFEETTINVTDRLTKFDLGGLVEIGANYKVAPDILLSVTCGYQHSFTSITNENYFSNAEVRHYGMLFSLGLKYVFKKE